MKGIDKLLILLAKDDCPRDWGLDDIKYVKTDEGCLHGNGGDACIECWKLAIDSEVKTD